MPRWDKDGNPIAEAPKRWDKDGNPISGTSPRAAAPRSTPSGEMSTPGYEAAREDWAKSRGPEWLESIMRGVTFGQSDSIYSKGAELQTALANPVIETFGGKPQWTPDEAKRAVRDEERAKEKAYKKEAPIKAGIAEFGGGLLLPFGKIDKGLKYIGMGSQTARGALQGAVAGGLAGHGAANTEDKEALNNATLAGTITGGGIGALATPLISLAQHGISPFWNAGKSAIERLMIAAEMPPGAPLTASAMKKGTEQGNEYVRQLVQKIDPTRARLAGNPSMEPIKLKAGEIPARPITAAEALGREGQTQLKVMGRRGGTTPDKLEAQMAARVAETPGQVSDDFATAFGVTPDDIEGAFGGAMKKMRENAKPLYDEALGVGPVSSETLEQIATSPAGKRALDFAYRIAGNELRNPEEIGLSIVMNRVTGQPEIAITKTPTMATWDYMKRGLDSVIERDFRDKTTRRLNFSDPEAYGIVGLAEKLRGELVRLNPAYERALLAGGEPIRMEKAFTTAAKLMQNGTTMKNFETVVSKLSPSEQQAFVAGLVNDVRNNAAAGRQRLNLVLTPLYEAKLARFLGADDARALVRSLEDRKNLVDNAKRMKPGAGSDTSETLIGRDEQDMHVSVAQNVLNHLRHGRYLSGLTSMIAEPLAGALRGVQAPIDRAARDRAGQLLSLNPQQLLKELETYEATIPGWQKLARRLRDEENVRARMAVASQAGAASGDATTPERR